MRFLVKNEDEDYVIRFPVVTAVIVVMNIVVFVIFRQFNHDIAAKAMGFIPSSPSISSFFTSIFYHVDVYHLIWNMIFLWLFGPKVEDALGNLQYLAFYFASGAAAVLLHLMMVSVFMPFYAGAPLVGASGAVAGIVGMFAVRFYKSRARFLKFSAPVAVIVGFLFLQQLAGGVSSIAVNSMGVVSYWSHIGGVVFGIVVAYLMNMGLIAMKEHTIAEVRGSLDGGDPVGAVECLHRYLSYDPDDADANAELARIYAMQQLLESSAVRYKKCIDKYLKSGDLVRAEECFSEFMHFHEKKTLDPGIELRMARYLATEGCGDVAVQILENIAESYRDSSEAESALVRAVDIYLNVLDDRDSAIRCYKMFLVEYPHSALRPIMEKIIGVIG